MGARTKARKRAVDLVFEADQRGLNLAGILADRQADSGRQAPLAEYTVTLVTGVVDHWRELDDVLATYSQGWPLERMPGVDRAILRVGAWEVLHAQDVPDAVAISEAVALATELSTDESPKFVNGLLARISEIKATLA